MAVAFFRQSRRSGLRAVCLAVVAAIVLLSHGSYGLARGADQAIPVTAEADQSDARDLGRADRCAKAAVCWILPGRHAAGSERAAEHASPRRPWSARGKAKWVAGPPEQPPRSSV